MSTRSPPSVVLAVVPAVVLWTPAVASAQGPVPALPEMDVDRSGTPVPNGSTENVGTRSSTFTLA
jgi:hypothetical protein